MVKEKDKAIYLERQIAIYEERINKVVRNIEHELYEHILLNDEDTWSPEFYTNEKLDYRKLLISFLQDYLKILKGEIVMKPKVGDYIKTIRNSAVGNNVIAKVRFINYEDRLGFGKFKNYYSCWQEDNSWFELTDNDFKKGRAIVIEKEK